MVARWVAVAGGGGAAGYKSHHYEPLLTKPLTVASARFRNCQVACKNQTHILLTNKPTLLASSGLSATTKPRVNLAEECA